MAEIALYREGLRNVNTFYISEGLLLKDALSGYSLEQLVDYVQAHIQRMEQDLENLDLLINQEVSRMSIRLYVTDKPDAVDIINQVLQKIRALNGTVTRAEYGNFMPEVMHNPFFIDVKLK